MTVLPGLVEGPVGLWARAWGGQCPQVCAHRCVGTGETRGGTRETTLRYSFKNQEGSPGQRVLRGATR